MVPSLPFCAFINIYSGFTDGLSVDERFSVNIGLKTRMVNQMNFRLFNVLFCSLFILLQTAPSSGTNIGVCAEFDVPIFFNVKFYNKTVLNKNGAI